jgi:hypothetical protein
MIEILKLCALFLVALYEVPIVVNAQSWEFAGLESEPIKAPAVDWSNTNIIYAGSLSDYSVRNVGGIFRTSDGGTSWDTLLRGIAVVDLDIHPNSPNVIYATLAINVLTQQELCTGIGDGFVRECDHSEGALRMNNKCPQFSHAGESCPIPGSFGVNSVH